MQPSDGMILVIGPRLEGHSVIFLAIQTLSLLKIPSGTEILVFWALQRLASLVALKDVQLMTRRDDLELSHGATAKVRENAVKQDRVRVTNAIGHHPERPGFLRRTEFIGGTGRRAGAAFGRRFHNPG